MATEYFGQKPFGYMARQIRRHLMVTASLSLVFFLGAMIGTARINFKNDEVRNTGPTILHRFSLFIEIMKSGRVNVQEIYEYRNLSFVSPTLLRRLDLYVKSGTDGAKLPLNYANVSVDEPELLLPFGALNAPPYKSIQAKLNPGVRQASVDFPAYQTASSDKTQVRLKYSIENLRPIIQATRQFSFSVDRIQQLGPSQLAVAVVLPPGIAPNIWGYPAEAPPLTLSLSDDRGIRTAPLRDVTKEFVIPASDQGKQIVVGTEIEQLDQSTTRLDLVVPLPSYKLD